VEALFVLHSEPLPLFCDFEKLLTPVPWLQAFCGGPAFLCVLAVIRGGLHVTLDI
jgi:hypothetical protein